MKRIILLFLFMAFVSQAFAQDMCQVTGIVRFEYNDYIGYRPDLGAEVYFIPKSPSDTIPHLKLWEEYEDLAHRGIMYRKSIAEGEREGIYSDMYDSIMRRNWRYEKEDEARVDELDKILFNERNTLLKNDDNVALVDASGMYTISLPKGEYIVVFVSANRKRSLWLTELLGRTHVTEIELKGVSKKASYDFAY